MLRAVKNSVDLERLTDDEEEDSIRESVRQDAVNFALCANDPEQFRISRCAIGCAQNLVEQFFAEAD